MSSLHSIVDNNIIPTHYILKQQEITNDFTQAIEKNERRENNNNNNNNKNKIEEEEEIDILDDDEDEDEEIDDDDDEDDNDEDYVSNTNNNNNNNNNKNNYHSINHIISPNNAQSPNEREKEREQETHVSIQRQEIRQEQAIKPQGAKEDDTLDLLKENRHLRKKMESLMSHNMQLMLGVKERDNKIFRQKRLLVKYRKALLRFFEENESSSSDEELSPNEFSKTSARKDARLDIHLRNMTNTTQNASHISVPTTPSSSIPLPLSISTPTLSPPSAAMTSLNNNNNNSSIISSRVSQSPPSSPPSPFDDEKDDDSEGVSHDFDFEIPKKRKTNSDLGDLEPDKKRRNPRRNALWTPEDDEMFQKIYNVYGKSWKTIHNYMPGKTREQVQSHGQYLIRIGKLEDIKGGPRRGRKGKKEKSSHHHSTHSHSHSHSQSPQSSHSSLSHSSLSHSSHSHSSHHPVLSSHSQQFPPMTQLQMRFEDGGPIL